MTTGETTETLARFTYFRAFVIEGLWLPVPEVDLGEILPGVRVFVSQNLDARCRQADQAMAIADLLLNGLFAPDGLSSAPDRIQQVVDRNVLERNNRHGQGPFVLLVCQGTIEQVRTDELRELEGILIGFNAVDKEAVRTRFEEVVRATLAAIALNLSAVVGFQSVVDQVVVYQSDSQPVFSYTPRIGLARGRANHLVDIDKFAAVARQAAIRTQKTDVARVQQLLLRSLLVDGDRLRAFLSAWTALEILVNKLFSRYEEALFEDLSLGRPDPMPQYLNQIKQAMSSRYRLRDKFTVISSALDPAGAAADLADFETAKKLRDSLSHGEELSDDALPLEITSALLRKYLALHLNANST